MVQLLREGLKECHSLIQRGGESIASAIFEEEVVPSLHRVMKYQERMSDDLVQEFMALKFGSYLDLAGFLAEKGIKKRGQ